MAGEPPIETVKGAANEVWPEATSPGGMPWFTWPNPTPKSVIVSPTFGSRDATPEIAPGGSAYVTPSEQRATTYWIPLISKPDGASNPGSVAFTVTLNAALEPASVFTTTGCGPDGIPPGT